LERRSDAANLTASAELYRGLHVDSTLSFARSRDFVARSKSLSYGGRLNATATLTRRLSSTLGYAVQRAQTEAPDVNTRTLAHVLSGSSTYTFSRLLNFTARFDFLKSGDVTDFSHRYQVDWIPTSKMSFFLTYRRSKQDVAGAVTGSDSGTVSGRWNISRHLSLDGTYIVFRSFAGDISQAFSSSLQFRF
jgi:hypothetical protein